MSSPRITFQYSGRGVVDPWWVRLDQEGLPDDTATLSDAANLIDTLYNLDACEGTTSTVEDLSVETVETTVEATVAMVACLYDADGNVDVVVRVIRSRQDAEYRLALVGGVIKTTENVRETITQQTTLENASSLTLDYPVIDGFVAEWRGWVFAESGRIDPPPISRIGNTLDFDGVTVASGTILATYLTEYDRCVVTILGKNGKPGECTARAFFHGLVDELALETPDAAEKIGSCTSHWQSPVSNDEVTCYREVTISTRCECSDREVDRYTYDEITSCPEYVHRCPGNDRECMHLLESVEVPEYVACDADNQATGRPGRIYELSTPKYYKDKCCSDPSGPLPQCPEKTTSWRGGVPIAGGADQYYIAYGPELRIVPVSPPGGICGTWTIKQAVLGNNCCDDVEPLAWDASISPEVMAPNGTALIAVTGGGKYPYEWTVVGSGWQFQNGSRRIVTVGPVVRLSALALACGTASITVTDGCSSTLGEIRSTSGRWGLVYTSSGGVLGDNEGVGPWEGRPLTGLTGACEAGTAGTCDDLAVSGRYRVMQRTSAGNGTYALRDQPEALALCAERRANPPYGSGRFTGQVFTYPGICMSCGQCSVSSSDFFDRKAGHHSTITPWLDHYGYWDTWITIDLTTIEEWVC